MDECRTNSNRNCNVEHDKTPSGQRQRSESPAAEEPAQMSKTIDLNDDCLDSRGNFQTLDSSLASRLF